MIEKKSGGLAKYAVGGVVGALFESTRYLGYCGIIIVTKTKIHIGHFYANYSSSDGKITTGHLKVFKDQTDDKTLKIKSYDIAQTQVSASADANPFTNIQHGIELISFRKSSLYVNDKIYPMPDAAVIRELIIQQGSLITPTQFIELLNKGENPISEENFINVKDDKHYLGELFRIIMKHPSRNKLVQNFQYLAPPFRTLLEDHIISKGNKLKSTVRNMLIWVVITLIASLAITVTHGFINFLCIVSFIVAVIVDITYISKIKCANWCRKALNLQLKNPQND
jgi:hypothetical protein